MLPSAGEFMLLRCFKYALQGITSTVRSEHNFRFMMGAFGAVVAAGAVFSISSLEWACVLGCCGLVLGAELINTAIEAVVDLAANGQSPLAKKAKDAAAGASLVVCVFSAVVGLIIFLPYIRALFS